ncbi:MAG: hypothetical protein ACREQN_16410 [Candidatus Binataceae bacterium]
MTIYFAAVLIAVAVALFVAAPLSGGLSARRRDTRSGAELERLEHERGLAMQGLRELEFDHAMGKLEESDYHDLRKVLENRALAAMSALEKLRAEARASRVRFVPRRPRPAAPLAVKAPQPDGGRLVNFCPQCGMRSGGGYNFCAQCGASLQLHPRTAARAE